MATKLTISVLKLRTGDGFVIKSNTATPNWTSAIKIVADNPGLLEAQDTSNIVPASEEWITAVENLVTALQDIPFFNVSFDIAKDKTLITCNSTEQIETDQFNKLVPNGSEFEFVTYIDADGYKITATSGDPKSIYFGPLLVPNITVTEITHELNEFTGLSDETYPRGNPGNEIKTEVFFTTRDSLAGKQVEFSYGLLQNTTNPYTGSTTTVSEPFKIDPDYFSNRLTGTIQTYRGEFATASNPLTPINWDSGSLIITNIVNNNYKATHIHRLLDLGTDDTNDDATQILTPSALDGKKSIKYVFEVVVYPDNISALVDETTAKEDLTLYMNQGAIGWFDQVYNSPTKQYTLNSFTWNTPSGELNPAFNSVGDAVVKLDTGTWNAADQVIIAIQSIIEEDEYAVNVNLTNNIQFENVVLVADGTPVSGSNLINVSATIDAGDNTLLNVSLEVVNSNYTDRYSVTAQILTNSLTSTISLKSGTVVTDADESVITFGTYPSAALTQYNFNFHWNKNIVQAFNQVIAFTEDNYIARWRVVNSDTSNTSLSRFRIKILNRETNLEYETLSVNASDMPLFTKQRVFRLDTVAEDEYVEIIITDNLDGTYDFQYPFQIWKQWFQEANMVFRCECRFDQVLATGETVTFTNTFDSPDFELGNYDTTLNTILEPQALRKPPSIQFEDEATGNPLTIIKNEGLTRVIATFEDNNLNDLQVFPAAPHVYTAIVENGLTGYLSINDKSGSQSTELQFHNFRTNPVLVDDVENPWEKLGAHPTYNSTITRTDIKTATIEAVLNADKIKALFGDDIQCIKVSGRLDAYRVPELCFSYQTDALLDPLPYSATMQGSEVPTWSFQSGASTAVNLLSLTDRSTPPIGLAATDLDGRDQIVKVCMVDYTTVTTIVLQDTAIISTLDLEFFTGATSFVIANNPDNTDLIFPTHALVTTKLEVYDADSLITLDLTVLSSIGGRLWIDNNINLATVSIPASTELMNYVRFANLAAITSVDLSMFTRLGDVLEIVNNDLMTSLTIPSSTEVFTKVQISSHALITTIDFSGFTKVGGLVFVDNNPSLTSISFPTTAATTETVTSLTCLNNALLTSIDISKLDITGSVHISTDALLNAVTLPPTNIITASTITSFILNLTAITSLNFNSLDMSGVIAVTQNTSLTSVTLPTGTETHTDISLNGNALTAFDIIPRDGASNDGIDINLNSNALSIAVLDTLLSDLATVTSPLWDNGVLDIKQIPAAIPTGGAANADLVTLQGRGWLITFDT